MPDIDMQDDLRSTRVTRENGYTTISFIRARDTGDSSTDLSLNNDLHFVYGWNGPVDDYATSSIGYHRHTPIVSQSRISLPDSSVCVDTLEAAADADGASTISFSVVLGVLCAAVGTILL